MAFKGRHPLRVLSVPGLHGSGPAHWQTWLEAHYRSSVRVVQQDWAHAEIDRWAQAIATEVERRPGERWVAVAHSFGCLALARFLARGGQGVEAALFVAPADPERFSVSPLLPQSRLAIPSVLIGSDTDPWMAADSACAWASLWGSQFINLGDVGHINVDAGFGPLPQAKVVLESLMQRVQRTRRPERAHLLEWSFAV